MTRAYLRLDPAFDERKESYPDGPYAALIGCFCLAESQPQRGRFRSTDYLRRLLGHRGRFVAFLLDHGDLVVLDDGTRVYVDGWDEWQEGDWKVQERVARIRNRKRARSGNAVGNGDVTVEVTPLRQSVAVSGAVGGAIQSGAVQPTVTSAPRLIGNLTLEERGVIEAHRILADKLATEDEKKLARQVLEDQAA